MTTIYESDRHMLCLNCGEPGALPLRLRDGRDVRACAPCLRGEMHDWASGSDRGPIRFEPGSQDHDRLIAGEALNGAALFSPCRTYRYSLSRRVGLTERKLAFAMLNPSTADETQNDPTIRRCIDFAAREGFGRLYIINIFALRSTDPRGLKAVEDPVGPLNDTVISIIANEVELIVCAWGEHGSLHGRDRAVIELLKPHASKLFCLGTNKSGSPKHPLYLRADAELVRFGELRDTNTVEGA